MLTKAKENPSFGLYIEHYFLHLICADKGYGSPIMDSILKSADEDKSVVLLESLPLPFGFYRSRGFIFDEGVKDRRSFLWEEVKNMSRFTGTEDRKVKSLSDNLSKALAEKDEDKAERYHTQLVKRLTSSDREKPYPQYGFSDGNGLVLMTRYPGAKVKGLKGAISRSRKKKKKKSSNSR